MRDWRARGADIVAVAGVLGVIAFATYLTVANNDLRVQLNASQSNGQQLYEQLLDEGVVPEAEKPAEVAPGVDGQPGDRGPKGEPGDRGGVGPVGAKGDPGMPGVTGAAGVAGPAGVGGSPGSGGASGVDGLNGLNGTNGINGADGRGVAAVSCALLDDLTTVFRFTFTDATTQDVLGACNPLVPE